MKVKIETDRIADLLKSAIANGDGISDLTCECLADILFDVDEDRGKDDPNYQNRLDFLERCGFAILRSEDVAIPENENRWDKLPK